MFRQDLDKENDKGKFKAICAHRLASHCRSCYIFPQACCVEQSLGPPSAEAVRAVTSADDDDSEDSDSFGSPYKGRPGIDEPMLDGRGPLRRGITDGASLLSRGRWPHSRRRFPTNSTWTKVSARIWKSAKARTTPEFLHKCAHQKLLESAFDDHEVADPRKDIITILEQVDLVLERQVSDRQDLPVDWRLFGLVLAAIGVGVKLPRIPPLLKKKRKWRRRPQEQLEAA